MRKMVLAIGFAWIAVAVALSSASAQISIVPGNSARGAQLFTDKGCVACHALNGAGGKTAPDLTQAGGRARTPMQLAASLWNHAPRMWRSQKDRGIQPMLDSAETADLFAYFYSLYYSASFGNTARGERLFDDKGCLSCHETEVGFLARQRILNPDPGLLTSQRPPARRRTQSPVWTWGGVDDPMAWAEQMWNHSARVEREYAGAGIQWPRFSAEDLVDMLTYLRSLPEARSISAQFQPGNPEQGRVTFERACERCHSFGNDTAAPKVDLLRRPAPPTLTGYVAAMWNHAPGMRAKAGVEFPVFGRGDMNDLVAYLFTQRYFEETGDVQRGARLYETKQCATCHEHQRMQTRAPDLTASPERYSAVTVSSSVWRHGPGMLKLMPRHDLNWPELKSSELSDIIAFLNSRLVLRMAVH